MKNSRARQGFYFFYFALIWYLSKFKWRDMLTSTATTTVFLFVGNFFLFLNFLWTILQPKKFFMIIHYLFIKVFWNYLIEFLQFDKIRIIPIVNTFSFVLQLLWWDKKSKTTVIIFSFIGWQIDQKFIFIHLFISNKIMS